MMPTIRTGSLKKQISQHLHDHGYSINDGVIKIGADNKEFYRTTLLQARNQQIVSQTAFIKQNAGLALSHMVDRGKSLSPEKIRPALIDVRSKTVPEKLFRWWSLVWWSLPYSRSVGRQMRFIVYDEYHQAVIGLIGLQSPIIDWGPRDRYLGLERFSAEKSTWINQSLTAHRIGAVPPYNRILGSRLVASLLVSREVRETFARKYHGQRTVMRQQIIPNRLLFITTTGAFGKSPIYDRFTYDGQKISRFLGYTQGYGSFHLSDDLYAALLAHLKLKGISPRRGYGTGPSRKLRLLDMALKDLGFRNGVKHQIRRGLYLFSPVANLKAVIASGESARVRQLSVRDLAAYWQRRWLRPRLDKRGDYRDFSAQEFIQDWR